MCNEKERKSTPYKKEQRAGLKKSKGKIVSGKRAKGAEHKSGKAWRIDWNGIAPADRQMGLVMSFIISALVTLKCIGEPL